MAKSKVTHSPKRRKRLAYREVKGKIVERVEVSCNDDACSIGSMFQDRTYLSFDVDLDARICIAPELSDWKTGNYKPLKRWPTVAS